MSEISVTRFESCGHAESGGHCLAQVHTCTLRAGLAAVIVAGLLFHGVAGEQEGKPKKADSQGASTSAAKKEEKKPQKKLSGAELYAIHCTRCHPDRYATERTAEQWKTVLLHMRTRANLPASQARAILQFLQEDSGR
jgi:hypothetical protein